MSTAKTKKRTVKKEIETFKFTAANKKKADAIIAKYPEGRQKSAVIPLLYIAQNQCEGWLPQPALDYIADYLSMPFIKVYEVATFYTMFNLLPVGKNHIQVCTTSPCWLNGSDDIVKACEKKMKVKMGQTSKDGKWTLSHVECLGACVNAPVVQIDGDDYYEDLDAKSMTEILNQLEKGKRPKPGSAKGRKGSMPESGKTTLKKVKG